MATDHKGRRVHAGKRTFDELDELSNRINAKWTDALDTLKRMPREWDSNFDAKDPAYVAAKGNVHRARTAALFSPFDQPINERNWGSRDQMLPVRGGLNMAKRIMDDPDTAHISLSNDEYL